MRVTEIWRYPVKSLRGELVDAATVTPAGLEGDRTYALFDASTGLGLTARRVPELLFASARLRPDGTVEISRSDGAVLEGDTGLSAWLGREVTLRHCDDVGSRQYENPDDFEHEDSSTWGVFNGARGAFHDSSRTKVSLVSTTTLGEWDRRRFRPNLVLDGAGEDELVGSDVTIGTAVLRVVKQIDRCVMVTRPQPEGPYGPGLAKDLDVLRTIHRQRGGNFAIGATVDRPGTVRVGDEVHPAPGAEPVSPALRA